MYRMICKTGVVLYAGLLLFGTIGTYALARFLLMVGKKIGKTDKKG